MKVYFNEFEKIYILKYEKKWKNGKYLLFVAINIYFLFEVLK